jgi:2'-5' RNA ligase
MVHSVELLFDPDTEAAIRHIWEGLAAAGLPSPAPASRPHVTLAVADRIGEAADDLLAQVSQRLPLDCAVGAPLLFGRSKVVLARLVVPSIELLAVHVLVHRLCAGHLQPGPAPHTLPGQWTPHVTLARRIDAGQLGRAAGVAAKPSELGGSFAGLRRWDGDNRVERLIS